MPNPIEPYVPAPLVLRCVKGIASTVLVVVCAIGLAILTAKCLTKLMWISIGGEPNPIALYMARCTSLSGSMYVAVKHFDRIVTYFENLLAYIRGVEALTLGRRETGVAMSIFAIFLFGFVPIDTTDDCEKEVCNGTVDRIVRVYPVFYKEDAGRINGEWARGVNLSSFEKERIKYLILGYSHCVDPMMNDTVRISVRGYPSYSLFKKNGDVIPQTDSLNLVAAHLRRDAVYNYIKEIRDSLGIGPGFRVDSVHWRSLKEVDMNRPILDDKFKNYSENHTRVAEIHVLSTGSCANPHAESSMQSYP